MSPDDIGRVITIYTMAGTIVTGTLAEGSKWLSSGEPCILKLVGHDHYRFPEIPLLVPWRTVEFVGFA